MRASLTRFGFFCDASDSELRAVRRHFDQRNFIRLPGFVDREMLRVVWRGMRDGDFHSASYAGVGKDLKLRNPALWSVLYLFMNDPRLFRFIRRAIGCGPIGSFHGRIYRMVAQPGVALDWHDDRKSRGRLVAISINLSERPYRGGTLMIRTKSGGAAESAPNIGFGDAIVFRIAANLEHRVEPVIGDAPKTALTGWFFSYPKFRNSAVFALARRRGFADGAAAAMGSVAHLDPSDRATIPAAVVSREFPHSTLVFDLASARFYRLNQTGARIWSLLAAGQSIRATAAAIAEAYGAPRRAVESDVAAIARQLAGRKLIRPKRAARARKLI